MRRLSCALAIGLLIGALAGEASGKAPSLREAMAAYRRGDFATALEQLMPLAAQDDAQAQFLLGTMYEGGQGVQRDLAAAARWYQAAAQHGNRDAQVALRRMGQAPQPPEGGGGSLDRDSVLQAFDRGDYSVVPDPLEDLARGGDAEAQYRLGLAYERGLGVRKSSFDAVRWYQLAAQRGSADAQAGLARMARKGDVKAGIAAYERGDYQAAYQLFADLAEDSHDAAALYWLGRLHDEGKGVAEDPEAAANWYRQGAQEGNGDAAFALARFHETGRGVKRDLDDAIRWYQAAAARGNPKAQAAVQRVVAVKFGRTVEGTPFDAAVAAYDKGDYAWAAEQFLPLAQQGEVEAQLYLGKMSADGLGVTRDIEESRRWLRMAAERGDGTAQLRLGDSYNYRPGGATQDLAEAARWYRAAAEQGNPEAAMDLANAYREGLGVVPDAAETQRWYDAAHEAEAGLDLLVKSWCAGAATVPDLEPVYTACNHGDHQTALRELVKLARAGDAAAQAWLGYLYYTGREIPVEQNYHTAARWLRLAAEQGNAAAAYNLAVALEHGMGVAKSTDQAVAWYRKAAAQGSQEAQAALQRLGQ